MLVRGNMPALQSKFPIIASTTHLSYGTVTEAVFVIPQTVEVTL